MVKSLLSYLILLCLCLYSCEKEQMDTKDTNIVGKTFSHESLSLTFESSDSVCFETINTLYPVKGKAKYKIDNTQIVIINKRKPSADSVTESYIQSFRGYLKRDKIDDATYSIYGQYEKEQVFGDNVTLFLK